jgi:hypothetical protein
MLKLLCMFIIAMRMFEIVLYMSLIYFNQDEK